MGNSSSDTPVDQRRSETVEIVEIKKGKSLNDLPETFSCHYNNVMSLVEATVAQEKLVDNLCKMAKAEGKDEETRLATLKTGLDILEKLQDSRYIQTTPVQDTVMDLYHNIQAILVSYNKNPFVIDSPFLDPSKNKQEWSRHKVVAQHQVIDGNLAPFGLNEKQQKELAILNKKLLEKQEDVKKMKEAYAKACLKINELAKSIDNLKKEQKHKDSLNDFLNGENERLIREIEDLRPPKISGTIQLYHSHSGNTIKDIETNLKALLKKHLKDIDLIKCNTLSEVDHSSPLIVLSIIASRVGTDAANAIKDVPRPENTALLLFHIKEIHALTKQASTAVLTDRSFKELGGIFDLAYVNGKGIYQCEMNDHALNDLCVFIKQGISGTGI